MNTLYLEFDTREDLLEAMETLKSQHNFTGEMSYRKNEDGTWRLTVLSEKRLRESTIEKMPGCAIAES